MLSRSRDDAQSDDDDMNHSPPQLFYLLNFRTDFKEPWSAADLSK